MKLKLDAFKNFGLASETLASQPGINAKMSEFNAAVRLLQLKQIDQLIERRRHVAGEYLRRLGRIEDLDLTIGSLPQMKKSNYSYFPILISEKSAISRDQVIESLKTDGIFARRYFFPLTHQFEAIASWCKKQYDLPHAKRIAGRILCLPIYPDLSTSDVERVVQSLIRALAKR